MSSEQFSRAQLLYQQNRYKEAEKELANLLKSDPNDVDVLALLSEVQLQQDKNAQATELIDTAISLYPENDYLYYIKARIAVNSDDYDGAEKYLREAKSLDPYEASYDALHAHIKLYRKQFENALELANRALENDPENILALNTRSSAQLKLGLKEEAFETIEGALNEDPNNAYTHANYGWSLLEKGDHKKALTHFSEALRNDPSMEYAQAGMAEALKARYWFYRIFLKYSFFMGNLTANYQWGVIVGFYFVSRILKNIAAKNEELRPFLIPVLILLALFAFSTWVIQPLSNLFLRLNKYGKHLLDNNELKSANYVGFSGIVFLLGGILFLVFQDYKWLTIAVFGLTMMIPLGVVFSPAKYKNAMLIYAVLMAVMGVLGISQALLTGEIFGPFSILYMLGITGFQWVANYILIREDNV